jgi:hypothetical protein
MATQALGNVLILYRGTYDPAAVYQNGHVAAYGGDTYLCVSRAGVQGVPPVANGTVNSAYWVLSGDNSATRAAAAAAGTAAAAANTAAVAANAAAAGIGPLMVTNLLTRGNFDNGVEGWTGTNATLTAANNILRVEATGSGEHYAQASIPSIAAGHIYYMRALVSGILAGTARIKLYNKKTDGNYEAAVSSTLLGGESGGLSLTLLASSVYSSPAMLVRLLLNDGTANANEASFSCVSVLDLTAAFGAGREPTAAVMDALIARWPSSYFSGTVNLAPQDKMLNTIAGIKRQLDERTGYGVASGLAVTAQETPGMTVAVAAGVCYEADGMRYTVPAVSAMVIAAADAANPRIDAIYEHRGGAYSMAGTAAATPVAPTIPSDGLLLAWVNVAAGVTAITSAMIVPKKKTLLGEDWITPTLLNGWTAYDAALYPIGYCKDACGIVHIRGLFKDGAANSMAFTLPVGYRPNRTLLLGHRSASAMTLPLILYSGNVCPSQITYASYASLDGVSFKADQ